MELVSQALAIGVGFAVLQRDCSLPAPFEIVPNRPAYHLQSPMTFGLLYYHSRVIIRLYLETKTDSHEGGGVSRDSATSLQRISWVPNREQGFVELK